VMGASAASPDADLGPAGSPIVTGETGGFFNGAAAFSELELRQIIIALLRVDHQFCRIFYIWRFHGEVLDAR